MAFPFGQTSGMGGGNQEVQMGPELQEIETQEVGFLSIGGDSKVQLIPKPWPAESLPSPTSSLLSVASKKGLLAAAGPEGIIVARTDSVRKAYTAESPGDSNAKPFQPELQIPLPTRISHVAFSADENVLVVAVESGDGLAAYDISKLMQGTTQPAATLSMNGQSLRSLVPNPVAPELFAVVTTSGDLLVANLKSNQLVQGPTGQVFKSGVSSVSWSTKGKQLVAGLGEGSLYQLKPDGQATAEIPRAPEIGSDHHVSSISWLENNLFFVVYTPTAFDEDSRPASSYYNVIRQPPDKFQFRKLPEVCSPFGLERFPAYQFTARLKDFEPNLSETLIVSSTASTDIGLFTKSSKPLTAGGSTENTVGVFTSTTMADDSRRAALPMTEDMTDTSPVGLALDLSSKDTVVSPIPGEDIDESSTPLPAILVLHNDGLLSSWWFVYSESIKQKKPYHGLAAVAQNRPVQQQQSSIPISAAGTTIAKPSLGQQGFSQPAFGKPAGPAFGTSSPLGANRQAAFGSPSVLGASAQGPSASGATPMAGGASFGSPSNLGQSSGFGKASALGGGGPLFGKTNDIAPSGFAAMKSGGGGSGLSMAPPSGGGGFSAFASGSGGFASVPPSTEASPFAKTTSDNPFGKPDKTSFGSPANATSPFGGLSQKQESTPNFGLPSGDFSLKTGFQPDPTASMDEDKPDPAKGKMSFGPTFGNLLNAELEGKEPSQATTVQPATTSPPISSIPTTEPFVAPKSQETTPKPGIFGMPVPQDSLRQESPLRPTETTTPTTSFTQPSFPVSKEAQISAPPPSLPEEPSTTESNVEVEVPSDFETTPLAEVAEPPLPPEPTSKATYAPGDTSASSSNFSKVSYDDAPLPPDFVKPKKPEPPQEAAVGLPDESEGEKADFEDSGEDVANEISPTDETAYHHPESFKTSPESSFGGGPLDKSPTGGLFTKVSGPEKPGSKKLFGEVTQPVFPPPKIPEGRVRMSPRSPSPVRKQYGQNLARADGIRSTSAPSAPGRALSRRKATLESSMLMKQASPPPDDDLTEGAEEMAREAQRIASESQPLSEGDEDEQLRADLARPISPSPALDPFLPHQDYTGESLKPGIPGQIERLYRDINTMIDTLGINARSLSSFLLYQESTKESDYQRFLRTLKSDRCADVLDERLLLSEMGKLQQGVDVLDTTLQKGRIEGVQEKFERCQQLISKDLATLRGQCASVQRTLDAHTDTIAIASAPLSAEQSTLQQDLRKSWAEIQSNLAGLEREVSVLRAKVADSSASGDFTGTGARKATARPTVEAVTSTINTMTSMAEKKSGDIDVLEARLRKMGIDILASPAPARTRDASPFQTPQSKKMYRLPVTPGSRGSNDGVVRSLYHTPDSARRFRSSVLGQSGLREVDLATDLVASEDLDKWKAKNARRKEVVGHLRSALSNRKVKVRSMDE